MDRLVDALDGFLAARHVSSSAYHGKKRTTAAIQCDA